MLIRSVGLFWKRDHVHWRSASKNGRLLGVPKNGKQSEPVNFRDQIGVYVLYADYDLVYVGQTGGAQYSMFKRLRAHTRDDLVDRWNRFSWFGIKSVTETGELASVAKGISPSVEDALNHVEAVLIHAAEPPLNRQSGRFGQSVTRYLQSRDKEKLGPTAEEMMKQIWDAKVGN